MSGMYDFRGFVLQQPAHLYNVISRVLCHSSCDGLESNQNKTACESTDNQSGFLENSNSHMMWN